MLPDAELIDRARAGETIGNGSKQIAILVAAHNEALTALTASHKRRDELTQLLIDAGWSQPQIDDAVKKIRERT